MKPPLWLIRYQDRNPGQPARCAIDQLESRARPISGFAGFETRADDIVPRAAITLKSREARGVDQAQLEQTVAVNVLDSPVVAFLVKGCTDELGQGREKSGTHVALPGNTLYCQ